MTKEARKLALLLFLKKNAAARNPSPKQSALCEEISTLQRTLEEDYRKEKDTKERLDRMSVHCVEELGRCLEQVQTSATAGQEKQKLTKIACRFLSLWFDFNKSNPQVTEAVAKVMPRLSLGPLAPFIYQLASRLGTQDQKFQSTLQELLLRIARRGAHGLWPLLLIKNGDQVEKNMRNSDKYKADTEKLQAAKALVERLRAEREHRQVVQAAEALSKLYITIAFYPVDKNQRNAKFKVADMTGYKEVKNLLRYLPVPTAAAPLEGQEPVMIKEFEKDFGIAAQGVSAPKTIDLFDTQGRRHSQFIKGMDDLRQDAVMQQLFRLINDVLTENALSRQADLSLRTFQVVPLTPVAGVMEKVTNANTLGAVLQGNTNPAAGAHARYRPKDITYNQCRQMLTQARQLSERTKNPAELDVAFDNVCRQFQPVMHLVFLERWPSPMAWRQAQQRYARSVAVTSMVGYIFGIGDRHPNNILFGDNGELVHIDFGMTFEAGKQLKYPEVVPVRLSRDVVAGLGCLGTGGLFRYSSETTLNVLREAAALCTAVVEVFVHDPLYNWAIHPRKAQQSDRDANAALDENEAIRGPAPVGGVDGNAMAKKALLKVKGKLRGEHTEESTALSVPAHVSLIIRESMDPANLSKLFVGWAAFV
eukprot:TRINITY_DN33949_c0_g1_i1.p1 TRINITY_DN33949_c0_g1~~TRINITY_DN33949_c0_g1_i1.p1  ORF type:complete len:648 (+),score=188.25 TRINITY_DN33949_c0_g1_i1:496-2439(+)